MCTILRLTIPASALLLAATPPWRQAAAAKDDPFTSPRTAWFREAKFGMFIHWGLYAVPAGEWKGRKIGGIGEWIMHNARIPIPEYEPLARQFNPVKFDAKEWVRTAKAAGMRYMVITSKHHDGFSMFDTKVNDYNIVKATPWKRDPMKELAAACKAEGIKFCFYYSIMDWHHPDANDAGASRYIPRMREQLRELVTQYDPWLLWFDGEWVGWWSSEKGRELEAYLRSLKPSLVVNNRIGKRRMTDGDYETPEQEIPRAAMGKRLWETCMTLNDTWGFKKDDHNWKPPRDVIFKLCDIASKGGNFLLNVGPDAEGVIPAPSVKILEEAGRWVAENGEAIYGTTASPLQAPAWGRITRKGNRLYLIVFQWPASGRLSLALSNPVRKAALLKGGEVNVNRSADGTGIDISVPTAAPSSPASIVFLDCEGEFQIVKSLAERTADGEPMPVQPDGSMVLPAFGAKLAGDTIQLEGDGEEANVGYWTKASDTVEWHVQPKKAGRFRVELEFACDRNAGGEFTIAFGAEQVRGKIEPTGGWKAYRKIDLGVVNLPAAKTKVVVRPGTFTFALMNLRAIRLIPVP